MDETIKVGRISIVTLVIRLIIDFFATIILIGFVWFVRDLTKYFTTKLEITSKRIVGKTGLVNTNELDSPLNKINAVQVKQGMFGKIFNYGTICITTASSVFEFDYIDKPNEFKTILNNQIEIYDEEKMEKHAKKIASAIKD